MTKLETRVGKLEQSQGRGCFCLLYTNTWSKERLETEVARLKKDYASVLPLLISEADLAA